MIKEIIKDEAFLSQKGEIATADDVQVGTDLLDTLKAHEDECVGLAANMIGVNKRIIVINHEGTPLLMFNPTIIKAIKPYKAKEGCLSLDGTREATRYKSVRVRYQSADMVSHTKTFAGYSSQIIQHEVDHCEGILI